MSCFFFQKFVYVLHDDFLFNFSLLLCRKIHICVTRRGFLAQFIIMHLYILWQLSSKRAHGFYVSFNSSFACLSENIPSYKMNDNRLQLRAYFHPNLEV